MSKTVQAATRQRLEMQGFIGCDNRTLGTIRPWLRVAPAICGIWMAAAVFSGSALALWALVPFALLGALLRVHPFDLPYNAVIRRWAATPAIPAYAAPRRFACLLAAVWISLTAWMFQTNATRLGLFLGLAFIVFPALYVMSDFCVVSWLYDRTRRSFARAGALVLSRSTRRE